MPNYLVVKSERIIKMQIDEKKLLKKQEYFRAMFKKRMILDKHMKADMNIINKHQGILPDELLLYWKEYGFSSFNNGIYWLTNPDDYTELVRGYLKGTPFEDRKNLFVVARNAFGKLYVWETTKGGSLILLSINNMIFSSADADRENYTKEEENFEMINYISKNPISLDDDDASGNPLFERALKKLGKLESDEMYGYKLSHFLGGKESITNLTKMNLFNHYEIQKELKAPTISVSDMENNTVTY